MAMIFYIQPGSYFYGIATPISPLLGVTAPMAGVPPIIPFDVRDTRSMQALVSSLYIPPLPVVARPPGIAVAAANPGTPPPPYIPQPRMTAAQLMAVVATWQPPVMLFVTAASTPEPPIVFIASARSLNIGIWFPPTPALTPTPVRTAIAAFNPPPPPPPYQAYLTRTIAAVFRSHVELPVWPPPRPVRIAAFGPTTPPPVRGTSSQSVRVVNGYYYPAVAPMKPRILAGAALSPPLASSNVGVTNHLSISVGVSI